MRNNARRRAAPELKLLRIYYGARHLTSEELVEWHAKLERIENRRLGKDRRYEAHRQYLRTLR